MLLIPLLKTVDFTAAMKLVILFGFQNGGLDGPNRISDCYYFLVFTRF